MSDNIKQWGYIAPGNKKAMFLSAWLTKRYVYKRTLTSLCLICLFISGCLPGTDFSPDSQSIYYVRYDTFMVNHRAVRENLVMVPAYEEFRIEKFARVNIPCTIPLPGTFEKEELRAQAIHKSIKQILETRGLIQVTALNTITVVSYEGLVKTPFDVQTMEPEKSSKTAQSGQNPSVFSCTARFDFSPLSFPSQWAKQRHRSKLKKTLAEIWGI